MTAVEERTVSVWRDQIRPRVKIAGQGPPLVFFHGAYGLAWDPFLDTLAKSNTVYAPEHPGTTPGDPDAIRLLDDLWDLVLYYYEIFDQLGLEAPARRRTFLWGHGSRRGGRDHAPACEQTRAGQPYRAVAG